MLVSEQILCGWTTSGDPEPVPGLQLSHPAHVAGDGTASAGSTAGGTCTLEEGSIVNPDPGVVAVACAVFSLR